MRNDEKIMYKNVDISCHCERPTGAWQSKKIYQEKDSDCRSHAKALHTDKSVPSSVRLDMLSCQRLICRNDDYGFSFYSRKKPAMTLAEILIVVVIVAIIGCVLIAMPRKNVSTTDRAKYFIAYSTLQRLLNEQLADNGKIALCNNVSDDNCKCNDVEGSEGALCQELKNKFNTEHTFNYMVSKWLNTAEVNDTNAKLTNGMKLYWSDVSEGQAKDASQKTITTEKVVCFDIDGDEGRDIEGKDRHCFLLYRKKETTGEGESEVTTYNDIRIKPVKTDDRSPYDSRDNIVPASNDTWLTFKVFKVKNNGKMDIRVLDKDYRTSYDYYDDNSDCNDNNCFIEPIPPLK